ncbi:MAG: hypothetical protein V1899_04400 [Planctomycetota bacterium]
MRVFIETTIPGYLAARPARDIVNGALQHHLRHLSRQCGYELPVICTPEELMEEIV